MTFQTFEDLQQVYSNRQDGFACFLKDKGVWVWIRFYGDRMPKGVSETRAADGRQLLLN